MTVGEEELFAAINPREWLPPWVFDMLQLWRMYQGGGMGGVGYLPNDAMEQPSIMLQAFGVLSSVEAELWEKK